MNLKRREFGDKIERLSARLQNLRRIVTRRRVIFRFRSAGLREHKNLNFKLVPANSFKALNECPYEFGKFPMLRHSVSVSLGKGSEKFGRDFEKTGRERRLDPFIFIN